MADVRTGAALFTTGSDGLISGWNEAAEELTGIASADAEGRSCWDVIAGRDERGDLVCHPGCSIARLAREGWPVRCTNLHVSTPGGTRRLTLSTIVVPAPDDRLILHPMRETAPVEREPRAEPAPSLTRRQSEILMLLVDGVRAKEIAARLTLSETTVRNHIRAILLELGAHSQLEAVARARALTLVA